VQAAHARLNIIELPVPLIYLEEARSFGGSLDDAQTRLAYYRQVIDRSLAEVAAQAASNSDQPVDEPPAAEACCSSAGGRGGA
jgi:dolichol-phosphate mannosyltransferase